jgi:glycerol uptake facilitator-like aquaporin
MDLQRRLAAETLGCSLLLATVVGSGIMAERLAGGNTAIALLGNTIPTGAILVVLITIFGPVSGAHFNPLVTLAAVLRDDMKQSEAAFYVLVQLAGAVAGVLAAHVMFDLPLLQHSSTIRTGVGQWFAEIVAAFGLLTIIFASVRHAPESVAMNVGLYITAAYWFTASTSFANPAVTLARAFSNTFTGIRPIDVAGFIGAQIVGALLAIAFDRWLERPTN